MTRQRLLIAATGSVVDALTRVVLIGIAFLRIITAGRKLKFVSIRRLRLRAANIRGRSCLPPCERYLGGYSWSEFAEVNDGQLTAPRDHESKEYLLVPRLSVRAECQNCKR